MLGYDKTRNYEIICLQPFPTEFQFNNSRFSTKENEYARIICIRFEKMDVEFISNE